MSGKLFSLSFPAVLLLVGFRDLGGVQEMM